MQAAKENLAMSEKEILGLEDKRFGAAFLFSRSPTAHVLADAEGALNRCRALAGQIESELCNRKPEHFVDKLSLADFYASLERAADVLRQKSRRAVNNTPAPAPMGSQARDRQRHR
jgi:hypothetical protein